MRIVITLLVFCVLILLLLKSRSETLRFAAILSLAGIMFLEAVSSGLFHLRGRHTYADFPFEGGNHFNSDKTTFRLPNRSDVNAIQTKVESHKYRSIFLISDAKLPFSIAAYVSEFWKLRGVDGYSSGIPKEVANLPWPPGILGLRTIGFRTGDPIPWNILSLLNVKYAIPVDVKFYRGTLDENLKLFKNPLPVVPRYFFSKKLSGEKIGIDQFLHSKNLPKFLADESFSNNLELKGQFDSSGAIQATSLPPKTILKFPPSDRERLLIFNERYHPNWKVVSGGQSLKPIPVNGVMLAAFIPAGLDTASLQFEPFYNLRTFLLALLAAVVALVFLSIVSRKFIRD